jgi:hypothetical protein
LGLVSAKAELSDISAIDNYPGGPSVIVREGERLINEAVLKVHLDWALVDKRYVYFLSRSYPKWRLPNPLEIHDGGWAFMKP